MNELSKVKLLQSGLNVKFDTDFCFNMGHDHYCGVADELAVMNDPNRPYFTNGSFFTNGDVVFAAKILGRVTVESDAEEENIDTEDEEELKYILEGLSVSQRDYITHEARKQGHDSKHFSSTSSKAKIGPQINFLQ